ncbi:MAG TPA: rRNA maturation RNase YbeY [bacterium]|nr:rRNA maturation RNase YbeY [bacterium]HPV65098.1 rRNA maturation RNase YbeY [bacterium]
MLIEINNSTKEKINLNRTKLITEFFVKKYKIKKDISIAVIGDQKMKEINNIYRGFNKTTDVLSFEELNEVIINIKQIKRQAKEFKRTVRDEFEFILVHGLLHLVGFDDYQERGRLKMISLGEKFLSDFNSKLL